MPKMKVMCGMNSALKDFRVHMTTRPVSNGAAAEWGDGTSETWILWVERDQF